MKLSDLIPITAVVVGAAAEPIPCKYQGFQIALYATIRSYASSSMASL